jgi:hypothetical protein
MTILRSSMIGNCQSLQPFISGGRQHFNYGVNAAGTEKRMGMKIHFKHLSFLCIT